MGAAGGCRLPTGPPPRRSWGRPQVTSRPRPPLTSAAPLHARPRAAPSAPQARRPAPARARPLGAARPGPAFAAPPARPAPVRPEWAVQRGGGVRGASPPRARTRAGTPRHARPAGRTRGPRRGTQDPLPPAPKVGRLGTRRRRRVTLYPYPGPGASGSWSLFEHKGPGARAAALPPPLLQSKPAPQDTLSGFGVQSGAPRVSYPLTLPGCRALLPRKGPGPRLGPCLPALPPTQRLMEAYSDLRKWRHLATYSENTPSPPQPWGPVPGSPAPYPLDPASPGLPRARLSAPLPSFRIICSGRVHCWVRGSPCRPPPPPTPRQQSLG